jgi:two-component system, sensor histidine kinase
MTRWSITRWVWTVGLVLTVTITPLAWIQWQQFRLLDDISSSQTESPMWHAYQLESELHQLERALEQASGLRQPAIGADDLSERYEIFLSRVGVLIDLPRRDDLDTQTAYVQALSGIVSFTQLAEPLMANPAAWLTQPTEVQRLLTRTQALRPLLAELTSVASRAMARVEDERKRLLLQQSKLIMGLAAAQTLLLLALLVLLGRHLRQQLQQNKQLTAVSQALQKARDDADSANRGKSVFLANMSHEIRTPFQGVLGMLNLLDATQLSPEQRDYIHTARESATHLLRVLNDILDVSTMESGHFKLNTAPVHLPSIVKEVDNLMRFPAQHKGIALSLRIDPLAPTWVMGDATRLRQIFFNLINNAIKFTSQGGVSVNLDATPDGSAGFVFSVRDSGIGMDPSTLDQLFTRFYQADDSVRRRLGGTGLGLDISRQLCDMMGGEISVNSEPGLGSVFMVRLPLPDVDEPDMPATEATSATTKPVVRGLHFLVAEDHPVNMKFISIVIQNMGHTATYCGNGVEALAYLTRDRFDVALLDYHMPELDGLGTTEALRQTVGPNQHIPVILVTADVINETREKALAKGVSAFVSKPMQASDLQRALQTCGW